MPRFRFILALSPLFVAATAPSAAETKQYKFYLEQRSARYHCLTEATLTHDLSQKTVTLSSVGIDLDPDLTAQSGYGCSWIDYTQSFIVSSTVQHKAYCVDYVDLTAISELYSDPRNTYTPTLLNLKTTQALSAPYCRGLSGANLVVFGSLGAPVVYESSRPRTL